MFIIIYNYDDQHNTSCLALIFFHNTVYYIGWWEGEDFPRIVGVCSAQSGSPTATGTLGDNDAGGGQALWDLISYARANA